MDTTTLIQNIDNQLSIIDSSIRWVHDHLKGEIGEKSYYDIVKLRRHYKKMRFALLSGNPSAVLYGVSQVGKSYMASALLGENNEPFYIVDGKGKPYNFINDINPRGDGKESTGVVTRFTTKLEIEREDYPVKINFLSIADLVLILCDSYYNDLKDFQPLRLDKLNTLLEEQIQRYDKDEGGLIQSIITEDDILVMEEYFRENFSGKSSNILDIKFFTRVSKVIHKVDKKGWSDIFSLLWNNNPLVSPLFVTLVEQVAALNYPKSGFVKIDTVLEASGTILDIQRLREMYDTTANQNVDLLINGTSSQINKNILSALTAEVVFKVSSSKKMLENFDILDFPGARGRLKKYEHDLKQEDLPQMLLRGKVAYLFNMYSDNQLINHILLCHFNRQTDVREVGELIDKWVKKFVGKTEQARKLFMDDSKIAPLFIIGTYFNKDLAYNPNHDKKEGALTKKWDNRFNTFLVDELLNAKTEWLDNWLPDNTPFKDLYLLRDFYWSGTGPECSRLYSGYSKNPYSPEDQPVSIEDPAFPNYREKLRESFVNHNFVRKHTFSPQECFDAAATINNDGTDLIISRLTISAENSKESRDKKFKREILENTKKLLEILTQHYHSDQSDENIKKAKETAGKIEAYMDVAFGADQLFFGQFLQTLLVNEGTIYQFFDKKIQDIILVEGTDLKKYSAIKMKCPSLDATKDFDDNVGELMKTYEQTNREATLTFFADMGIDLQELFYGDTLKLKKSSEILAADLTTLWFENTLSIDHFKHFMNEGFPQHLLAELIGNLKVSYRTLGMEEFIAQKIRRYVDGIAQIDTAKGIMADICAEIINSFVNTMGYKYRSEDQIQRIMSANNENQLGLTFGHDHLCFNTMDEASITQLYETMDNLVTLLNESPLRLDVLKNVPNYSNYCKWSDFMKISFVANCDIPKYDVAANQKLGEIINPLKIVNDEQDI